MFADTIVITKHLFTGTEDASRPGAFAVADGRIIAVGDEADVMAYQQCSTQIIDVGESFVCSGLHDSHLHFFHSALYSSPLAMRYRGTSEADCVAHLAELAQNRPAGSWLLTQGWREVHWDPPVTPTKASLDEAYPDRPVAMYSGDAHTLWLNTKALEELGVDESSAGAGYDRDEEGKLTGIVREASAMKLMPKIVASFTDEELEDAYVAYMEKLVAHGITSVCDMSLMAEPGLDFVHDEIYCRLLDAGKLPCRVHMFPTLLDDMSRFEHMHANYTNPMLRAPGMKQFFDGVSSQHTAWLAQPYANPRHDDDCGMPTVDPAIMRKRVMAAQRCGYPVRIHTIGDMAIHTALDIFAEALESYGPLPDGCHHCLEHLEGFLPDDIARMQQLGVVAAVQPMHIMLDPGAPEADLGSERVKYMWPFKTLLETGATLAFGTDSPVCDIDPLPGLFTAVERKTLPGRKPEGGWLPEERITAAQALTAYTLGSAVACDYASELGSIEAGKHADFVVFDRDLTTCPHEEILEATVVSTWVAGKQVYAR